MADNPFTKPTISGYNASPPPDDGTTGSDNEITWAKHKTKLGDPLNTFASAIADNTETAFASTINTGNDQANTVGGTIAYTPDLVTIASGAITPSRTQVSIATESAASTDDLDTINAGSVNNDAVIILRQQTSGDTVVVKHATGNIKLGGDADMSLADGDDRLGLMYDGTNWIEIFRSPGVSGASQTQMEAATSTAVAATPGTTQYHPGVAKAWLDYDHTAPSTSASYNITSVNDDAAGIFTVTLDTDMSSANYAVFATAEEDSGGNNSESAQVQNGGKAAGTTVIEMRDAGGTLRDFPSVHVLWLGDQ